MLSFVRDPASLGLVADILPDFMQDWWFLGLMALILLSLIGLLLFLRNKRPED